MGSNDNQTVIATHRKVPEFLNGGGQMGERMRAFDWSATPLGEPSQWLGRGCVLTLRLPQHSVATTDSSPVGPPSVAVPAPSRALRVLVVDDNRDAASRLAELLSLCGHEVVLAEDGPRALAAAKTERPFDVAVLDIGLRVMIGCELAQALRQRTGRQRGDLNTSA